MNLMRIDPLVREFEGLMQRTFAPTGERGWTPAVDVFEREGDLVIRASVAGVKPDELDIRFEDGRLTIAGTRTTSTEDTEQGTVYRREIQYGAFARTIQLPERVDVSAIKATHKEGILEIVVPKPAELQPHKIAVEAY